jgi:hypothetical protein
LKDFLYLEVDKPRYNTSDITADSKASVTRDYIPLWIKENKILGSAMMKTEFYATCDFNLKICL